MSTVARAPALPTHRRETLGERAKAERRLGILLSAPAVIVLLAVAGYPILNAAYLSLFDYRLTDSGERTFVGLENYRVILTDDLWWTDFGTTLLITVVTVSFEMVLGFAFALVMHHIIFGRDVVRTAILVPYAVITVVSAYAWQYAFASDSGFINPWLGLTTDWFGERNTSLVVICLSEIWKTTSFVSLLLLAGLAQVPDELHQAATVDGANWWQRFTRVTIPNMQGAIMVALLFRVIDAFRIFDNVFIMTAGAENTETLSILAYRQTISRAEMGLGSAVSILLFLSVLLICVFFIKVLRTPVGRVRGE
ncbi:MAG TPA: sugar ABC transporter permease [Gaiellaceae bacterium]|jgi:multiple sugar transport system permease protein|nr:sugar ABC transporter permease [Gaiellaceae bacterium]HEX2495631.1 sugar ABC transporter permease [Gaiellaceae bacterium]